MNPKVDSQVKLLAAPVRAVRTRIRFFPGMSPIMHFEAVLVVCGVRTVGALVSLLGGDILSGIIRESRSAGHLITTAEIHL